MAKPSIVTVLEHYGFSDSSRYVGMWVKVRCPFHGDRHASAGLNEEAGQFYCHVCDIHGDVYGVVELVEGVGFNEAKRLIQEWTGQADDTLPGRTIASRSLLPSWTRRRRRGNRALSHR